MSVRRRSVESTLPTPAPASLADAGHHLSVATALLAQWHDKVFDLAADRTYVAAGHEAVDAIDAALAALHTARCALVGEIRREEDERAVRVDRMLAESPDPDKVSCTTVQEINSDTELPPRLSLLAQSRRPPPPRTICTAWPRCTRSPGRPAPRRC